MEHVNRCNIEDVVQWSMTCRVSKSRSYTRQWILNRAYIEDTIGSARESPENPCFNIIDINDVDSTVSGGLRPKSRDIIK